MDIANEGTNSKNISTDNVQFGYLGNANSASAAIITRDTVPSLTIYYKLQFNTSIDKERKLNLWLENGDVLSIPNHFIKKGFYTRARGIFNMPINKGIKERLRNQKVMK